MNKTALLIIDVQQALVDKCPYHIKQVLDNICRLMEYARLAHIEIIYVRHDDGVGEELEKGTDGWQIDSHILPYRDEKIFDKQYNSAFKNTKLHDYLQSQHIQNIILVGMQTEYCIDTTCKAAFNLDYHVIIPKGCTTTFDNEYLSGERLSQYFEDQIWQGRFAEVLDVTKVIEYIKK